MEIKASLAVSSDDLEEFQRIINVYFENPGHLIEALLHGSIFSGDKSKLNRFKQKNDLDNDNYEKLEYLGDSVLGLIIVDYSYHDKAIEEYAKSRNLSIEGALTEIKIVLASNENLVPVAHKLNLEKYILHGDLRNIENIYANVIEAIIGAIFLDQGFSKSQEFVNKFFDIKDALGKISYSNPKGTVKEICDKVFKTPYYSLIKEEGPDHSKKFTVELEIDGVGVSIGEGSSIKKAELEASKKYLLDLNEIGCLE